MFGPDDLWIWLVAHVQVLLPEDWLGAAGELFREGTQVISQLAVTNGVMPEDLLEEGLDLGRRKLTGVATKEHAEAEKNYAEAAKAFTEVEDQKIETELKKKVLEFDVQKRQAEARTARANAEIAEIKAVKARIVLEKKLREAGVSLYRDQQGNLVISPNVKDVCSLVVSDAG